MIDLTGKQRRELRAQAHALHPVVSIGQQGLTPRVLHEIDVALRAHALVKVRVFSEDRAQRDAMLARIAADLGAAPVQHLGKLLIVWRPAEEKAAASPPAKASRPRVRTSKGARTSREQREPRVVARRGRGRTSSAEPGVNQPPGDPASRRRRNASSPAADARAPTGKSAPNPRRRRAS